MKFIGKILDKKEDKLRERIYKIKQYRNSKERRPLLIREILFRPQLISKMISLLFLFISSYLIVDYLKGGEGNLVAIIFLLFFAAAGEVCWRDIERRDDELLERAKKKYGEDFSKSLK